MSLREAVAIAWVIGVCVLAAFGMGRQANALAPEPPSIKDSITQIDYPNHICFRLYDRYNGQESLSCVNK